MVEFGREIWWSFVFYIHTPVGPPRAGWLRRHSGSFRISPWMETLNLFCSAVCISNQPPLQQNTVSWCSEGTSWVSVCAHYLIISDRNEVLSLKAASLCPLDTLPSSIYIRWWDFLWAGVPALSALLCGRSSLNHFWESLNHLSSHLLDALSSFILCWGIQNWTQHLRCGLPSAK